MPGNRPVVNSTAFRYEQDRFDPRVVAPARPLRYGNTNQPGGNPDVERKTAKAVRALLDPLATGPRRPLDFGSRGWLAIDPKGLLGERTFDYANIFTNPDLSDPTRPVATRQGRLATRLDIVAGAAGLERRRLLQWVLAWAGLSAAWIIEAGDSADVSIAMAQLAAAELDR